MDALDQSQFLINSTSQIGPGTIAIRPALVSPWIDGSTVNAVGSLANSMTRQLKFPQRTGALELDVYSLATNTATLDDGFWPDRQLLFVDAHPG